MLECLSRLKLLMLQSPILSPHQSLPPGGVAAGTVEHSLVNNPRPARGDGGFWQAGQD